LTLNLPDLLKYYEKQQTEHKEDSLIDILITQIEKKKSMITKLKILMYLFSISKLSTYDVIDLITRKKLKSFAENNKKTLNLSLF
jgi:predicted nucleotidyltransferase